MYDRVKFYFPYIHSPQEYDYVRKQSGVEAFDRYDLNTGEIKRGKTDFCGFHVDFTSFGMYVSGSLNKLIHGGSNLFDMDINQAKEAIQKLTDSLQLDFFNAKLIELEFGVNLVVKHKPNLYFSRLVEYPRKHRDEVSKTTLYFVRENKNDSERIKFYDKIVEATKNKMSIPDEYQEKNVLRVEMCWSKKLARQLNEYEVTGQTLCETDFYNKLLDKFCDCYEKINKQKIIDCDMSKIKSSNDLADYVLADIFSLVTDFDAQVEARLQQAKEANVLKSARDYTRAKDRIRRMKEKLKSDGQDPLLDELNNSFAEIRQRRRV